MRKKTCGRLLLSEEADKILQTPEAASVRQLLRDSKTCTLPSAKHARWFAQALRSTRATLLNTAKERSVAKKVK